MKLDKIAKLLGKGPPMFFAMDTKSEPDTLIVHFVQFTTIHVKDDGHFDQTTLLTPKVENDPRLEVFADLIKK